MPSLTVAWISDFPIEWLDEVADSVRVLPRGHPATWQRVLLNEFEQSSELKLHIIILRKQISRSFSFERKGVTFHLVKVPGGIRAPSLFWADTLLVRPVLKRISPDLVHAWGTERGAGLVANRLGYPYLVTIQGLMTWYRELIPLNGHERLAAWLEDLSLPKAPLVTTESTFAVRFLKERFSGLKVMQAEHAPAWLFHSIKRRPQTNPFRFVFVGSFGYRKGGDLILHTLDQLKDEFPFELRILGSVEAGFREKLASKTSPKLWDSIQIKLNLSPAEIAQELAEATMMVFPTRADTSPNAVKEAVVAGVPVAGSAVGGIVDYVIPGKNGIVFESNSLPACIEAVRAACRHPLFSKGQVDEATLAKMRAYLSPKLMGERFLEAYQRVLSAKG